MPSTRSSPAIQQVPVSPRVRFASVCTALWSSSKSPAVICLAALLGRPSITRSPTGRYFASISKMAESKSTTTSWKTPSAYRSWKENWLFSGDADAGQRSAVLYTIIESCRCRGINPHAYLRDVLTSLPSMTNWQVKHVTPEAWAKAFHSPATATAA